MTTPLPGPLVSAAWLHARLSDPLLVLLDASWYLPTMARQPQAEFLAAHLPGAQFFDLDGASAPESALPHTLPSSEQFARTAQRFGVTPSHTVVVYDGSGANLSAGRVWWMFRVFGHRQVAVLDGGIGAWRRAGHATVSGEAAAPAEVPLYPAIRNAALVRDGDAVQAWLDGAGQVADARPFARFTGDAPEPRPGLRGGHMPGARSLPFTSVVDADGLVLPPDQLRARFAAAGLDPAAPMICSCGSGTSAGALLLALATLGHDTVPIYDGAWSEWGGDPTRSVVTGPA